MGADFTAADARHDALHFGKLRHQLALKPQHCIARLFQRDRWSHREAHQQVALIQGWHELRAEPRENGAAQHEQYDSKSNCNHPMFDKERDQGAIGGNQPIEYALGKFFLPLMLAIVLLRAS